jgi:hypothetical protein
MSKPCIVVIASADVLPKLSKRASHPDSDVLSFTDADALRALEVVTKRKPAVVALERGFAGTPRGAALINRIKADPSLAPCDLRVVAYDAEFVHPTPRKPVAVAAGSATAVSEAPPPLPLLDQRGTRRTPRVRIGGLVDMVVDGNQAELVDLSTLGAQVVSATVLKPNQRVRISLADEDGTVRFNAAVAWASFEIPPNKGPRYRAGLEFVDAAADALQGYCERHKA